MNNEIHWSRRICRSRERKFKVTGEAKNQLGRNKLFAGHREGQVITKSTELYHWVGFTGFVTEGCSPIELLYHLVFLYELLVSLRSHFLMFPNPIVMNI